MLRFVSYAAVPTAAGSGLVAVSIDNSGFFYTLPTVYRTNRTRCICPWQHKTNPTNFSNVPSVSLSRCFFWTVKVAVASSSSSTINDDMCCGQSTTKHQFQINLVSSTDPINVLLVNKDSSAARPSVTPVPPPKTSLSSASQQLPCSSRQSSFTDNTVTVTTASEASEIKDGDTAVWDHIKQWV